MTEPADKTPDIQARVIFRRETRLEHVRLLDVIDEALAELQQQIREHLPDYMAQCPDNMLVAEWDAAVGNGERWRMVVVVGRERARKGAG
jgi:hypothetical protein